MKQKLIENDLKEFFINNPHFFIYSPKIDDYCHIATIASWRYLRALSMILANAHYLIWYI